MKSSFNYLVSLFLGFALSFTGFAGDVDVHFNPEGDQPGQTISGDVIATDDNLNLVPDDSKKSNKVFTELAKQMNARLTPSVAATLVSNVDQTETQVEFFLLDYQGKIYFVAELEDGTPLLWGLTDELD